jgi:hypothetical protein
MKDITSFLFRNSLNIFAQLPKTAVLVKDSTVEAAKPAGIALANLAALIFVPTIVVPVLLITMPFRYLFSASYRATVLKANAYAALSDAEKVLARKQAARDRFLSRNAS